MTTMSRFLPFRRLLALTGVVGGLALAGCSLGDRSEVSSWRTVDDHVSVTLNAHRLYVIGEKNLAEGEDYALVIEVRSREDDGVYLLLRQGVDFTVDRNHAYLSNGIVKVYKNGSFEVGFQKDGKPWFLNEKYQPGGDETKQWDLYDRIFTLPASKR